MSELKVDKITPRLGTTLTLGDSGDTINFGSGVLPNFENLTVTGDLTVDTNSLKVDSTNNFVGIGTASPTVALDVVGAITATGNITGTLATASQPNITSLGTLTGLTTTGDINFGDNDKARFGATPTLELYSDGTNSWIKESGAGGLYIGGTNLNIMDSTFAEFLITGTTNGAVTLFYDNNNKLSTTSTGIDVTGGVLASGTLKSGTSSANLEVQKSGVNGFINMNDTGGIIYRLGSSYQEIVRFNTSETVINEGSIDYDFRVESNTNTHALFVQGSDGRVGIGTTSPATPLHLTSTSYPQFRITNAISFSMGVDSNNDLIFDPTSGSTRDIIFQNSGAGNIQVGIGTTSPSSALEVAGTIRSTVTDNSYGLILESTDDDAVVGPRLLLTRNSATPADGDALGQIVFSGTNDNYPEGHVYARIDSKIQDASNATEDGILDILTSVATSEGTSRIYIDSTGVTINDASIDSDFRVESNNAAHMLFVDGGNDRVGVYTSSPEGRFDTQGTGYFGFQNYSTEATQKALVLRGEGVSGVYAPSRFNFYTQPGTTDNGVARLHIKSQYGSTESSELFTFGSSGRLGIGTTTPSAKLDVLGGINWSRTSTYTQNWVSEISHVGTSTYGTLYFNASTSNQTTAGFAIKDYATKDRFHIFGSGSPTPETVFNEDSGDYDFRVESDTNTHALFVNGANSQVEYYISRQRVQYSGTFPGSTPTTVVDLSSLASTTYTGARIRAHGNENSYRNVSYGEWVAVRSFSGGVDHWVLQSTGQAIDGNNYGTVVLSMSGSNLQVKSGSGVATGAWRVSIELYA